MHTRTSTSKRNLAPVKLPARPRFFRYGFRCWLVVVILIMTGCPAPNNSTTQCDGQGHEFPLNQQNGGVVAQPPAEGGPIPFVATFPYPNLTLSCKSQLLAWRNPNGFRIGLITPQHNSSECFSSADATIVLNPGQSTRPDDLIKLYGQARPPISTVQPIMIGFCAEAGTNIPAVAITIDYTLSP